MDDLQQVLQDLLALDSRVKADRAAAQNDKKKGSRTTEGKKNKKKANDTVVALENDFNNQRIEEADYQDNLLRAMLLQGYFNAESKCYIVESRYYAEEITMPFIPAVIIELTVPSNNCSSDLENAVVGHHLLVHADRTKRSTKFPLGNDPDKAISTFIASDARDWWIFGELNNDSRIPVPSTLLNVQEHHLSFVPIINNPLRMKQDDHAANYDNLTYEALLLEEEGAVVVDESKLGSASSNNDYPSAANEIVVQENMMAIEESSKLLGITANDDHPPLTTTDLLKHEHTPDDDEATYFSSDEEQTAVEIVLEGLRRSSSSDQTLNHHDDEVAHHNNCCVNENAVRSETIEDGDNSMEKAKQVLRKRSSDFELKEFIYTQSLMSFSQHGPSGNCAGGKSCPNAGRCIGRCTIEDVNNLREKFWGELTDPVRRSMDRQNCAMKILQESLNAVDNTFTFRVGSLIVCESAFLIVLGLLTSKTQASAAPGQWLRSKKAVMEKKSYDEVKKKIKEKRDPEKLEKLNQRDNPKKQHALLSYIKYEAERSADRTAYAGLDQLLIVPFETMAQFYESYKRTYDNPLVRAGEKTFQEAFKDLPNVRLVGCKGHFQTCEICNSVNELMRRHVKPVEQEVLKSYKRIHLEQQATERQFLEDNKTKARQSRTPDGMPTAAFLMMGNRNHLPVQVDKTVNIYCLGYLDGMTVATCSTPKMGINKSKGVNTLTTRVVGCEAICASVDEIFLYTTNEFVPGGANTMVEITRQAISDLSARLVTFDLMMPRELILQFDNCGENKNKEMFSYCSLLVEAGHFDVIYINFLIVGHTHTSIDQIFSCFSNAIRKSSFIGSPLALIELFNTERKKSPTLSQITVHRQIDAQYDFKNAIAPYLNKKIKYYQIPHCFKISRLFGLKAIMQYKLFSSFPAYLPVTPKAFSSSSDSGLLDFIGDEQKFESDIYLPDMAILNKDEFFMKLGLDEKSISKKIVEGDGEAMGMLNTLGKLWPDIESSVKKAVTSQVFRMEKEASEGVIQVPVSSCEATNAALKRYMMDNIQLIEKILIPTNTALEGIIMWLNHIPGRQRGNPVDRPAIEVAVPIMYPMLGSDDFQMDDVPNKIVRAAKTIATAASSLLVDVQNGKVQQMSCSNEFCFDKWHLNHLEFDFYEKRGNYEAVVSIFAKSVQEAVQTSWQILPLAALTQEQRQRIAERKRDLLLYRENFSNKLQQFLVKPGHDARPDQEIVHRTGYEDSSLLLSSTKIAAEQRRNSKKNGAKKKCNNGNNGKVTSNQAANRKAKKPRSKKRPTSSGSSSDEDEEMVDEESDSEGGEELSIDRESQPKTTAKRKLRANPNQTPAVCTSNKKRATVRTKEIPSKSTPTTGAAMLNKDNASSEDSNVNHHRKKRAKQDASKSSNGCNAMECSGLGIHHCDVCLFGYCELHQTHEAHKHQLLKQRRENDDGEPATLTNQKSVINDEDYFQPSLPSSSDQGDLPIAKSVQHTTAIGNNEDEDEEELRPFSKTLKEHVDRLLMKHTRVEGLAKTLEKPIKNLIRSLNNEERKPAPDFCRSLSETLSYYRQVTILKGFITFFELNDDLAGFTIVSRELSKTSVGRGSLESVVNAIVEAFLKKYKI